MNHTKILFAAMETLQVDPDAALKLIDRLDKASDGYQKDMADLVSVGACIWQSKSLNQSTKISSI